MESKHLPTLERLYKAGVPGAHEAIERVAAHTDGAEVAHTFITLDGFIDAGGGLGAWLYWLWRVDLKESHEQTLYRDLG